MLIIFRVLDSWNVRQPMPELLVSALRSRPRLTKRMALLTFWGLNEERVYMENLGAKDDLTALAVEYRPRAEVNRHRLIELIFYHKQLILNLQSLRELRISYRDLHQSRFRNVLAMRSGEQMPPVEHLSLDHYRFSRSDRGLHLHINMANLRRVTLTDCQNLDLLLPRISEAVQLKHLILRRPVYDWRHVDLWRLLLIAFLESQEHLEVLDLECVGLLRTDIPAFTSGRPLQSLRFHELEDTLCITDAGHIAEAVKILKSIDASNLDSIAVNCPKLNSLSIDLAQVDIKTVCLLPFGITNMNNPKPTTANDCVYLPGVRRNMRSSKQLPSPKTLGNYHCLQHISYRPNSPAVD